MTQHRMSTEPQPIADQVMVKCSCGWRNAVSVFDIQREGPSMSNICKDLFDGHIDAIKPKPSPSN